MQPTDSTQPKQTINPRFSALSHETPPHSPICHGTGTRGRPPLRRPLPQSRGRRAGQRQPRHRHRVQRALPRLHRPGRLLGLPRGAPEIHAPRRNQPLQPLQARRGKSGGLHHHALHLLHAGPLRPRRQNHLLRAGIRRFQRPPNRRHVRRRAHQGRRLPPLHPLPAYGG